MNYQVEATADGYRLTINLSSGRTRSIEEPGGHGPIEELYALATQTYNTVVRSGRQDTRRRRDETQVQR